MIGGIDADAGSGARNYIAPYGRGVWISGASNNYVASNYIGQDPTGAAGYGGRAVYIDGGSTGNIVGTDADGNGDANERNVLATGVSPGLNIVTITGSGTNSNTVAGNIIGFNSTETSFGGPVGAGYGVGIEAGAPKQSHWCTCWSDLRQ